MKPEEEEKKETVDEAVGNKPTADEKPLPLLYRPPWSRFRNYSWPNRPAGGWGEK